MSGEITILSLFLNASLLVKLIMLFLLFLSVASWTMIVQRINVLKRARVDMEQFEQKFWSGIDLNKLYTDLTSRNKESSGLELFFTTGFREFGRLRAQPGTNPAAIMEGAIRSMKVAHSREIDKLEQNVSWLATIGSTSPYIGLFGTVWGIMNSFIALGSVKQATLSMVAPGIAEALVATAMGLFAAIPAVIAYNRFNNTLSRVESHYDNFIEEFSGILHRKAHSAPAAHHQG